MTRMYLSLFAAALFLIGALMGWGEGMTSFVLVNLALCALAVADATVRYRRMKKDSDS
ncbi:hypothetical protein [Salsuginibacillus kocurii]|uniref:hypothetical protein n=1 Tax=Salsuginibacillus kocurii TaxID=427078 RepID=UPI00036C4754|nr:hypothetical protein [Salsuginibacillus kocurii]